VARSTLRVKKKKTAAVIAAGGDSRGRGELEVNVIAAGAFCGMPPRWYLLGGGLLEGTSCLLYVSGSIYRLPLPIFCSSNTHLCCKH